MHATALFLLALMSQGAEPDADPCRCARSQAPVERDLDRADVVFVGRVLSLDYAQHLEKPQRRWGPRIQKVSFQVTHIFKGGNALKRDVYVDLGAPCAFRFVVPDTYLIYAWQSHWLENNLTTTRCVRTAPIADAQNDIRQLRRIVRERDRSP